MAIIQEAFDIPDSIMIKLLTGECYRIGGVVRYADGPCKGQIVKLLNPVDLKATEQAQKGIAQIMKVAAKNKKVLLVSTAVAGTATVGFIIFHKVKKRETEVVTRFRTDLRNYIEGIRKGNMDLNTIEKLMASLDELKQHKEYKKFKVELSTEDFGVLVSDYTIHLAENNKVELTEAEQNTTDNSITNLQNYLKTQKRIFEKVV